MLSIFKRKKKKDLVYLSGKKHGEEDAFEYKKRRIKRRMPFFKSINPFTNYAKRYMKGYNDGYFEIVNGRKMIRASKKIDELNTKDRNKETEKEKRLKQLHKIQNQKSKTKNIGKDLDR